MAYLIKQMSFPRGILLIIRTLLLWFLTAMAKADEELLSEKRDLKSATQYFKYPALLKDYQIIILLLIKAAAVQFINYFIISFDILILYSILILSLYGRWIYYEGSFV